MSELKSKTLSGVYWATVRTVVTTIIAPLLLILRAQFLTPQEFGTLAIINIVLQLISVIENFGINTAVIQKDNITKNERSSLFFLQLFICLILGFLLIVLAPLLADLFSMGYLSTLLRILSITIFLQGPVILFTAFLEKEFHFKALSIIQICRELVLLVSTASLLFTGYGLYAVIVGQIIAIAVMAILIVVVSLKNDLLHMTFHFKLKETIPFITFGMPILGKMIIRELTHHSDELIIGYFLSPDVLGLYHFAKDVLNRVRALITSTFSKVMLPILSKVKHDRNKLTNIYCKISKYIGIFIFPIFVGISITSSLFIPIIFGEEWIGASRFFIILSIAYIPYLLSAYIAPTLLYAINKPKVTVWVELIASGIYISLLLIFAFLGYGINMVVILYSLYIVGKMSGLQIIVILALKIKLLTFFNLFKVSFYSTLIMGLGVLVIRVSVYSLFHPTFVLSLSVLFGFMLYVGTLLLLDKTTVLEMKKLIIKK